VPVFSTISVDDQESTPVTHDFVREYIDGVIARWREKSASSSLGHWPLSLSVREPKPTQKEPHYAVTIKWAMPVVVTETINGVDHPIVARRFYSDHNLKLPASATEQECKNFAELTANLMDAALVRSVLENREHVFAG
jgi:hypothetical protein